MTATQEQLAALAALLGITPETHRWLAKKDYVYPNGCGHGNPRHLVGVRLDVSKLPDPLGPDADGVWLSPMFLWLHEKNRLPTVDSLVPNTDSDPCPSAQVYGNGGFAQTFAETFTAALLQACLAARVPEVCKILEAK